MRLALLTALVLFVQTSVLLAQDIHFSQFFNSPLTLNPAQTGNFEGSYRAGIIYRDQWASVNSPYKTFSSSYDMTFPWGLWDGDVVSGGVMMFNDKAGDGNFTTTNVMLSGAYHKAIDDLSRLTLGVQLGYTQKKYEFDKFTFADMFDGGGFNQATLENIGQEVPNALDLNAGLQYSRLVNDNLAIHIGGAAFHIIKPRESFMNNPNVRIGMRYIGHAEANYRLNDLITVNPRFLYMNQTKAQEFSIGGDVGYRMDKYNMEDLTLYGGLWFRASGTDAVIPYIAGDYKNFRLGLSYDVNVSSLNEASNGKGGFEISLIYIGIIKPPPMTIVIPCLRF